MDADAPVTWSSRMKDEFSQGDVLLTEETVPDGGLSLSQGMAHP